MNAQTFHLPDVGEGLTEAEIVNWLVAPGDEVALNQVVCEIETAKSLVELPSPFEGVVTELLAEVGQTVPVGEAILRIRTGAGAAGDGQGCGAVKTVVLVEGDQVVGGCGGVERQFSVSVASRPAFGVFEQAAADATALEFRLDGELVQAGHASTSVNLALRRTLVPVQGERADDAPAADGDETLALADPLARDGDRLVGATAGQPHPLQARERAMQQGGQFDERILGGEGTHDDGLHSWASGRNEKVPSGRAPGSCVRRRRTTCGLNPGRGQNAVKNASGKVKKASRRCARARRVSTCRRHGGIVDGVDAAKRRQRARMASQRGPCR